MTTCHVCKGRGRTPHYGYNTKSVMGTQSCLTCGGTGKLGADYYKACVVENYSQPTTIYEQPSIWEQIKSWWSRKTTQDSDNLRGDG